MSTETGSQLGAIVGIVSGPGWDLVGPLSKPRVDKSRPRFHASLGIQGPLASPRSTASGRGPLQPRQHPARTSGINDRVASSHVHALPRRSREILANQRRGRHVRVVRTLARAVRDFSRR